MIHVLGYYDKNNIGDECYKLSFPKLFPDKEFIFCDNLKHTNPETIILGGGDVLNSTFCNHLKEFPKAKKYAFSVNVRSREHMHLFERVISRNKFEDVEYAPDFAFALNGDKERGKTLIKKLFSESKSELYQKVVLLTFNAFLSKKEKMLARDYINFEKVCLELSQLVDNTMASFVFVPFGNGFPENDRIANSAVYSMCKWWRKNLLVYDKLSVQDTLDLYAAADAAICTRFHACVFSCINNIPFIDICHHSKTKYLTETIGRPEWSLDYWHFSYKEAKSLLDNFLSNSCQYNLKQEISIKI